VIRVSVAQAHRAWWQVFARKGSLSDIAQWQTSGVDRLRTVVPDSRRAYHSNACAAYAACRTLGFAPKIMRGGVPFRLRLRIASQTVGEAGGVRFVNDSRPPMWTASQGAGGVPEYPLDLRWAGERGGWAACQSPT